MSEKLCLQWNDFQENVKVAFRYLRGDETFTDMTLACEDGQQVEVHKVILAASSLFFKKLLERNKHLHPLIYNVVKRRYFKKISTPFFPSQRNLSCKD